jgi:geranylgeranyl diphosphate synthase type II
MMILSYDFLSKYEPKLFAELFSIFNKTALEVCEGQQFDMNFESSLNVSINDYIKMIELKTSVLVAASFQIGAIIGGADDENKKNIYEYGKNLGIAFQLQDDLLDAFGETKKVGKINGGDIIANKKTFLLIHALENATGETKKELLEWLNKTEFDSKEKVESVKRIYNQLNIQEITQAKIDEYFNLSNHSLEKISVNDEKKSELKSFAEYLMNRDK